MKTNIANNQSDVDRLVESFRKGNSLKKILEDEGGDIGMLDKDKAKEIVEMLQDAQNIMDAAYEKLESSMSPMAMEDETVKTTMENLGKMTEDLDTVKDSVAGMAGMTEAEVDDDAATDDMEEEEGEEGPDTGQNPGDLEEPSTHQFTVKGVSDDQGFMNDLADLCQKYDGVMTANEEDTMINQVNDPERKGEQPDDAEVSKEIKGHMDLEGKLRKFRVTEGMKVVMLSREILPKKKKRAFESAKRKKKITRKFGK
jgi:hypothetical protein